MMDVSGSRYQASGTVFGFLEFFAWCAIILGVILAIMGLSSGGIIGSFTRNPPFLARVVAALPGSGITISGVYFLVVVQWARATVDTAEMTRELLRIARGEQQPLAPEPSDPTLGEGQSSPNAAEPKIDGAQSQGGDQTGRKKVSSFNGVDIFTDNRHYYVAGSDRLFGSIIECRSYIIKNFGNQS